MLAEHDLLVLPSLTEISPNIALEAQAQGLPVLLTENTGLSEQLTKGMILHDLKTPEKIAQAISSIKEEYPSFALAAAEKLPERSWGSVSDDHHSLFGKLL